MWNVMELQEIVPVKVKTLHQTLTELELKVYNSFEGISVGEIYQKVAIELGLKQTSLPHFALFIGEEQIQKRLKTRDYLPSVTRPLYLRKWCFDVKTEKVLLKDEVACHLIYKEAELKVLNGCVQPSNVQRQELNEYSDEKFRCEEKYVLLCHSIADYFSLHLEDCAVIKNETECRCSVLVNECFLKISTEKEIISLPWFCLKQWTNYLQRIILLSVTEDLTYRTVTLVTEQSNYLSDYINQIFKVLQQKEKAPPQFFAEMLSTTAEGSLKYQNPFFDLEKVQHHFQGQDKMAARGET